MARTDATRLTYSQLSGAALPFLGAAQPRVLYSMWVQNKLHCLLLGISEMGMDTPVLCEYLSRYQRAGCVLDIEGQGVEVGLWPEGGCQAPAVLQWGTEGRS